MKSLALPRGDWPLVVAGAVLMVAAYPPFHLFLPSFICVVPAVLLILDGASDTRPVRRHVAQGFWFGMLSNALVLYWMLFALWRFTWMSALGYFAVIIVLGLFTAVLFSVTGWAQRRTTVSLLVIFPVFWTGLDWIVAHLSDLRFPWLGLGTSLTGFPTVVQVADIVGARGLTFLLVMANTALALAWVARSNVRRSGLLAGGLIAGLAVAVLYGWGRERQLTLRPLGEVAVLQPNVGYRDKWEGASLDSMVRGLVGLAARAMDETNADLVVWPEAAVPRPFQSYRWWQPMIAEAGRATRTPQLVGGIHIELRAAGNYDYFNSAFLFDSTGRNDTQPVYNKRYLVPITERVPFLPPRWFNLQFFGAFGEGGRGPVYDVAIGRFGVLICYESIFENLSRDYRVRGAEFLVNITNDAWFGRSSAPYQHAAHLVMRAIENRVGIARAANTGISEFVDPLGRTHRRTALNVEAFESDEIVTTDGLTLYTRWGDWVGGLAVVLTAILIGYARFRRN